MKRWMLVVLSVLLLAAYGMILSKYDPYTAPQLSGTEPGEETSQPEETTLPAVTEPTAAETIPQQTQSATEPAQITAPQKQNAKPEANPDYRLTARHAFVYDCEAGEYLFTHGNMADQVAPASLTKLFTAWVVLQYLPEDAVITCGEETSWIDPASSVAWVSPGDQVPVSTLIQGMMMQSGNDAAYAAAVAAGRVISGDSDCSAEKALAWFMEEVNRRAQELGLAGTHFATPDGLDTFDHYTTPEDLLTIALLAKDHPLLRHYSSLGTASVMYDNGETHTYQSTNFLLLPQSKYYCPDACGMKTGTTSKAGSCLMSLFHNGEKYILIGILGCPKYEDRFVDALELYARYG